MTEDGYEVMGPSGFPATPNQQPAAAVPAFPEATNQQKAPSQVPQFPSTQNSRVPSALQTKNDPVLANNKVAVSVVESPASKMKETSKMTTLKNKKGGKKSKDTKKKKKNKTTSDVEENTDDEKNKVYQRPNCLDTCQLAFIVFLIVLIIAISTPVLLSATETVKIEYINSKLQKV